MDLLDPAALPSAFRNTEDLDDWLTRPTRSLVEDLRQLDGDVIILGASGKMGPSLARLAKRAAPTKRIIGVARFNEKGIRERLEAHDVRIIACDLLNRESLKRLPDVPNVVYMAGLAGLKFGSTGHEPLTWATNAYVPALVSEHFAASRIIVFSTGCIYPFVPIRSGGACEATQPAPPTSEYANSCVGRERIFQYFSEKYRTPGRLVRLNYAIDMRYGVLHDIARKVLNGEPIDVSTGHVNVIWQGDANTMALRSLLHCTVPASPINISGPETISTRALANVFGRAFGRNPVLIGTEADTAWLVNTSLAMKTFGYPSVALGHLVAWTVDWSRRGLPSLSKNTHYDARGHAD
jgi:nucleoside-diphosphate-sugar epimerase